MALVLLVNIFVARHLGPELFGTLSFFLASVALMVPLTSLGMNAIITREVVNTPERQSLIVSTALAFRLIGGGLAFVLLVAIVSLEVLTIKVELESLFFILAFANLFVAFHVVDFWFQAKVLSRYIVKVRFIVLLFISLTKLVAVYFNADIASFVWLAAIESLLISLGFLFIYLYKSKARLFSGVDFSYGSNVLKQSKWLILSSVASIIYLKIDQLMLAEMVSTREVGVYAVASRISEVWYFFPVAIVASFFPSLLKLKQSSEASYKKKLQQLCDALFAFALIIAVVIYFTSDWLILLLFGEEFQASGVILAIHIWAGLFVFMRALLSKWILAENLVKFSLITHGVGAVVNVALNYYLIPQYQGIGAAISTVIAYAFASYVVLLFHPATWPMAKIMTKSMFFPSRLFARKVNSPA